MVGNIGTIGARGATNGTNLDGIGMPIVPLVYSRTYAFSDSVLADGLKYSLV